MTTASGTFAHLAGAPAAPHATPRPDLDPEVIHALWQACVDCAAEPVERLALFEAVVVAANLRAEPAAHDGRLGPLAQPATWGPAPARRDPYTAATVFLREARRLRTGPGAPRTRAARLAARVQGRPGAWRHACGRRKARRILAGLQLIRILEDLR